MSPCARSWCWLMGARTPTWGAARSCKVCVCVCVVHTALLTCARFAGVMEESRCMRRCVMLAIIRLRAGQLQPCYWHLRGGKVDCCTRGCPPCLTPDTLVPRRRRLCAMTVKNAPPTAVTLPLAVYSPTSLTTRCAVAASAKLESVKVCVYVCVVLTALLVTMHAFLLHTACTLSEWTDWTLCDKVCSAAWVVLRMRG